MRDDNLPASIMSTGTILSGEGSFTAEMERLLESASRSPWGPGREIDANVYNLHQQLLSVHSRLGSEQEQPDDRELAHTIDHELRNKLMIFSYYEQKRSQPPQSVGPARKSSSRRARNARRVA